MAKQFLCALQQNFSRSTSEAVEEPVHSILVANIVLSAFLCYTTTMMNIVTIYALMKTSLPSTSLKILLLSLAFSYLGVGVLGFPFQITYLMDELRCKLLNRPAAITSNVVVTLLFLSSLSSIVAISADRFIAIQLPLRYADVVTRKRIFAVITIIWLFSSVFSSLRYGFEVIPKYSAFVVLVAIECFSFVVTTLSSYTIYLTVRRHKEQMNTQMRHAIQNGDMMNVRRCGSEKSSHGTLMIYLLFWVCYLPHMVISIVREIHASQNTIIDGLFYFSQTLVFLNSSINPVIYCWKMRPIRRTIMNIIRNSVGRYLQRTKGVAV